MQRTGFSAFIEDMFYEQFAGIKNYLKKAGAFIPYAHDITQTNAIIASQKADATAASATAANASQVATAASWATTDKAATTIESLITQYNRVWLGQQATDPTVDGNGDALVVGAGYANTTTGRIRIYRADGWADYDAETQELTNSAIDSASTAATAAATATNSATVTAAYASTADTARVQAQQNAASATVLTTNITGWYGGVSIATSNSGLAGYYIRVNSLGNAMEFRSPAQVLGDMDLITTATATSLFYNKSGDTGNNLKVNGDVIAGATRGFNGNSANGGYVWSDGVYAYGYGSSSVGIQCTEVVGQTSYMNGGCISVTNKAGANVGFYFSTNDDSAYGPDGGRFLKTSDMPSVGSVENNTVSTGGNEGAATFPGGTIIQWGYYPTDPSAKLYTNNNFPVEFPNQATSILAGNTDTQGDHTDNAYAYIISKSQYYLAMKSSTAAAYPKFGVSWIAWGN